MHGRLKPYLPELSIRDYNTYLWYQRGVLHRMYISYGPYACLKLRYSGALFALLADSLAGRTATCKYIRVPGTLRWKRMMCQTQGIRLAAQMEVLIGWHILQGAQWGDLNLRKKISRVLDSILLRRAYHKAARENPAMERIFAQEREHANVQIDLIHNQNYEMAADPKSNLYAAIYALLATDDPVQRKSMRYIGSCVGRAFYLLDKAESIQHDIKNHRYNVFVANGLTTSEAALKNARRQGLAIANDLVRAYGLMDVKLNRSLLDNIMVLGLRYAVDPGDPVDQFSHWELP